MAYESGTYYGSPAPVQQYRSQDPGAPTPPPRFPQSGPGPTPPPRYPNSGLSQPGAVGSYNLTPAGPPSGPPAAGPPLGPPPGMAKAEVYSPKSYNKYLLALLAVVIIAAGGGGAFFALSSGAAEGGSGTASPTTAGSPPVPSPVQGPISPVPTPTSPPVTPSSFAPTTSVTLPANPSAWVNEIDYDQDGTDSGEFIEIAVDTAQVGASNIEVYLYRGQSPQTFYSRSDFQANETRNDNEQLVSALIKQETTYGGITLYSITYPSNGIENGPDAVAVVVGGVLVEFIGYEVSTPFTASNGPANGFQPVNIGSDDPSGVPADYSLQLSGTGNQRSAFVFDAAKLTATKGVVNTNQNFT